MIGKHKKTILVVAHDAGGAEIIAAYVRKYASQYEFHPYVNGLAARIFERYGIPFKRAPRTRSGMAYVMKENTDATYALIGTGWMTSIEKNACKEAKLHGIKACTYLDSWMNYRERFGYPKNGWQKNLPDEFWVGDKPALILAKRYFPRRSIRLVKNQYFADIIARYNARSRGDPNCVLFMSAAGKLSLRIFSDFIIGLVKKGFSDRLLVRLHPADDRVLYEKIVKKEGRGLQIELSREKDIVEDLLRARIVVGPETVALVPAVMVGIKTIRIIPRGEKAFLPFPKIRIAKDIIDNL